MASENLIEQHRCGHQTVDNGGGPSLDCPVCVITPPEDLMHGLSNAEEEKEEEEEEDDYLYHNDDDNHEQIYCG